MRRIFSSAMLTLLLISTLALAFNVGVVHAQPETVYINSDGSVSPSDAPISTVDNVTYTFAGNISYPTYNGIIVERNNIVIDGNGYTLQGNQSGTGISLNGVNNVAIENVNIESFEYGIWGSSSSNNIVSGNEIAASACVEFDSSSGNGVTGNNMTNVGGFGVELNSCMSSTVSENNVTNVYVGVPWEPWIGVWLYSSSNCTVSENNVANETWGISLSSYSSFNTISENNITDNEFGIVLGYGLSGTDGECSNNTIYNNNFIDNYQQVLSANSINTWDNGYPTGGNYWSDYNGTDYYGGPFQNLTGSDGIGDTSYVIDENNTDDYPLMSPWALPDIAVTTVAASKTVIGQGYVASLNLAYENLGNKIEGFNASVWANGTLIDSQYVVLAKEDPFTVNFAWNTTGFAYGNYTISAYALPISSETNTASNSCTGSVIVTVPGDIDGNGIVNMADVVALLYAFGSTPGKPNWNPNCDIEGNGRIDMSDVIIALRNFGKTVPITLPVNPATNGFTGVKAVITLNSLSIVPFGGNNEPQMNLWLETGDHYYWIQVLVSWSGSPGYPINYPVNGFYLCFCAFDFGNVSSFPPTFSNELPGFPYPHCFRTTTIPVQLTLFTFIGTNSNLYTEFCINDQIADYVNWQSCFDFPNLTTDAHFVSLKTFSSSRLAFGNQIIFTEPFPVNEEGNGGILSTDGNMVVQTFQDGQFKSPSLGLVMNENGNSAGYPYYDNSQEYSAHLNWQINGNTVSFSPVTTISNYTGVAIIDNS